MSVTDMDGYGSYETQITAGDSNKEGWVSCNAWSRLGHARAPPCSRAEARKTEGSFPFRRERGQAMVLWEGVVRADSLTPVPAADPGNLWLGCGSDVCDGFTTPALTSTVMKTSSK